MMVYKRKQIVVLSLVLMIIVAGYLQYTYRKSSSSSAEKDNGRLGEAVYVDGKSLDEELELAKNDKNEDKKDDKKDNKKDNKKDDKKAAEDVEASQQANDFFYQAKIEKDVARSQGREALSEITEDASASKETRAKAHDMMMNMVTLAEKEAKIELLIKDLGFNDVVALFGDDGSLDIVVKAPSLSSTEVAQISDIASRQADIEISKIVISSKF